MKEKLVHHGVAGGAAILFTWLFFWALGADKAVFILCCIWLYQYHLICMKAAKPTSEQPKGEA